MTGTNLPTQTLKLVWIITQCNITELKIVRVHYAVSSTAHKRLFVGVFACLFVSVVIVAGERPVPFRTRKLSLFTLMVLHSGGCGRVGYCRPKT